MRNIFLNLVLLIFIESLFSSCKNEKAIEVKDSFVSYSKEELKYAQGFEIFHNKDETVTKILVHDLENDGGIVQTLLLHRNDFEKDSPGDNHFKVPLGDISVASTTHASYMLFLGLEKNIKGIAWASYLQNEKLIDQVQSGSTIDLSGSSEVDLEKLLATNSVAYTNYPFGLDKGGKMESLEVPLIVVSEYLEESALARAEWIKFFGALYGKSKKANEIFDQIEKEYIELKTKANLASFRPTVVIGSEQNGIWHMPGADSFISQMINDAGGEYLFQDFPGKNNQQVDMEILIERAANVNFWGKISNEEITKQKLQDETKKLQSIEAIDEGNVFFCNTSTTDYFGMAVMEPQLILKDLIHVFHPEILDDPVRTYFKLIN